MQSKGMVQFGNGNRQLQLVAPDRAQACLKHQGCSRLQMGENCPPVLPFCRWWQMSRNQAGSAANPHSPVKRKGTTSISHQGSKRAKKNVNAESQVAPVLEGRRYIIFYSRKRMEKIWCWKKFDADCHLYWSKKRISPRIDQSSSKGNRPDHISKCAVHVLEFGTAHTSCQYHSLSNIFYFVRCSRIEQEYKANRMNKYIVQTWKL